MSAALFQALGECPEAIALAEFQKEIVKSSNGFIKENSNEMVAMLILQGYAPYIADIVPIAESNEIFNHLASIRERIRTLCEPNPMQQTIHMILNGSVL